MASVVSIIPIVLLFILMLGFKMAGHKSALLTLVVTVLLALFAASPLGMIAPEHAEDSVIALTGWAVVEGILKAVFPILITLKKAAQDPPVAVIQDGCVMNKSLAMLGKNQAWLEQKLAEHRLRESEVFLMLSDADGKCTVIPKKQGDAA